MVLAVQKVLSASSSAGRLRLMKKYIGPRLVARPEPDNTFWIASSTSGVCFSMVSVTQAKYLQGLTARLLQGFLGFKFR